MDDMTKLILLLFFVLSEIMVGCTIVDYRHQKKQQEQKKFPTFDEMWEELKSKDEKSRKFFTEAELMADLTPCDVCAYGPPSSLDGKPCAMCPAAVRREPDEIHPHAD